MENNHTSMGEIREIRDRPPGPVPNLPPQTPPIRLWLGCSADRGPTHGVSEALLQ